MPATSIYFFILATFFHGVELLITARAQFWRLNACVFDAFSVRLLASIRIALRYLSKKSLMLPRVTCLETTHHGQNMPRARTVP